MKREIRLTEDGSTTLYDPRTGDTFHSTYGALAESQLIYIHYGLEHYISQLADGGLRTLSLLEVGFGTGLNLLLTLRAAAAFPQIEISYHTYELYPLAPCEWQTLTFPTFTRDDLARIHEAPWGESVSLASHFRLTKHLQDFTKAPLVAASYQLVYYDAFGPAMEPALWRPELITRVCEALSPQGVFVTYSTKGEVLRTLRQAGMEVHKMPGPKGKREVTQAIKCSPEGS